MPKFEEKRRFRRHRGRVPCLMRNGESEIRGFVTDLDHDS
jgi:hypothetical protein